MKFELKDLDYKYDSLEPYIDAQTMELHHSKHHKAYTDKFNAAIENMDVEKTAEEIVADWKNAPDDVKASIRNNGGGYINHNLFWEILKKDIPISGKISDAINEKWGSFEKFKDEFYQRRWTKPIFIYGTMYNEADVALAPLKDFKFNRMKSQLKVIEAGAHNCPIIASNFGPYQLDVVNGKHGFLIDENNKRGWYEKMKWFIENPNAVKEMGLSLNELVMEKYTLEKINKKRIDFFKYIVNL
ncbi:MAG: glycosyltransferase [Bacteroidota bacterium]